MYKKLVEVSEHTTCCGYLYGVRTKLSQNRFQIFNESKSESDELLSDRGDDGPSTTTELTEITDLPSPVDEPLTVDIGATHVQLGQFY